MSDPIDRLDPSLLKRIKKVTVRVEAEDEDLSFEVEITGPELKASILFDDFDTMPPPQMLPYLFDKRMTQLPIHTRKSWNFAFGVRDIEMSRWTVKHEDVG